MSDISKKTSPEALKERWCKRVSKEKTAHDTWRKQAKRAESAYRDEDRAVGQKAGLFPIWWSTVQITHAAIYAHSPKPDVRKRYTTAEAGDDVLAQAIERALSFTIDTTGFDDHGNLIVDDYLVAACGTSKIELKTETAQVPVIDPISQQPIMGDDGKPVMQKVIKRQSLRLRHFHWSKFGWEPGKDWESCDWVRFEHDMTPEEIEERWDVDLQMTSNAEPNVGSGSRKPYKETLAVQEIWDRKKRRVLFICEEHPEPLEVEDDPLHLSDFYPCPKPLFTNLSTEKLVPKTDYSFIESQCDNINSMTARIRGLTRQIKDVGFYDASLGELAKLKDAPDGTRVPIKNLLERLDKSGVTNADFNQVMAVQDNSGRVVVLRELINNRDIEKNVVFETLGISDIIRGSSIASETAEAQKIKSQWSNVRIGPKMKAIAVYFRDVFRIMAEIIAEHFEPEQIKAMTGTELSPEQIQQLRSDLARAYAIDVETDSTIAADDHEERQQRLEVVKAMTEYMGIYLPQLQQNLVTMDFVKGLLLFVLSSYKYGRELEEQIRVMPDNVAQLQKLAGELQQSQQQLEQAGAQAQATQAELQKAQEALAASKQPNPAEQQADIEKTQAETRKVNAEAAVVEAQGMAESVVAEQGQQAMQATAMAVQGLGAVAQQLAGLVPVLEQAAAIASAPKVKRARLTRMEDGSHEAIVEEVAG